MSKVQFIFLFYLVVIISSGCSPYRANKQHYIFPNGFSGAFRVIPDATVTSRLEVVDNVTILRFNSIGNLFVSPQDFRLIGDWADLPSYTYEDGTAIYYGVAPIKTTKYPKVVEDCSRGPLRIRNQSGKITEIDKDYEFGYIVKSRQEELKYEKLNDYWQGMIPDVISSNKEKSP